jgi:large subunit ribosomal protein L3
MCKGLIGKKIGMTAIFSPEGRYVPVTVIQAGPCFVTQVKTSTTDGYDAVQLGFGEKKQKHVVKPLQGHMKKAGNRLFQIMKEFPADDPQEYSLGQELDVSLFAVGEKVDITGTTKGRGFSGVIRRHGFSGGRKTHGSKCHRIPGSIGCSASPSRVFKGKRLPGHYGVSRKTVQRLEISDIRKDKHLLLVKGAVPGPVSGILEIKKLKYVKN